MDDECPPAIARGNYLDNGGTKEKATSKVAPAF
jgi:hypothetical protein